MNFSSRTLQESPRDFTYEHESAQASCAAVMQNELSLCPPPALRYCISACFTSSQRLKSPPLSLSWPCWAGWRPSLWHQIDETLRPTTVLLHSPVTATGKRRIAPVVLLELPWQLCTGSQSITELPSFLIFFLTWPFLPGCCSPPGGWVWLPEPACIFPFTNPHPPTPWGTKLPSWKLG